VSVMSVYITWDCDCGFLMREPRRADGRLCIDGAVIEARLVTSPAAISLILHCTTLIIQHNFLKEMHLCVLTPNV
jgi:hypothetical protein